jgi:DNA-binding MarR family transcriptional regulator
MREIFQNFALLRQALNVAARRGYKPLDLDVRQAGILRALHDAGPCSAVELCRATISDPAAINRALGALIRKGVVRQVRDAKDRRRSRLTLTSPAGTGLAREVVRIHEELAQKTFRPFSEPERRRFNRDLERLTIHLNGILER